MTYFVTALTNDKVRHIVKEARLTNAEQDADILAEMWKAQGFLVIRREEG